MARFTIKDLREGIDELNSYLEDKGSNIRFQERGRNGHQGVDEYVIDPDGNRPDSCSRNVCLGTSRECYQAAHERWRQISASMDRERLKELEAKEQKG